MRKALILILIGQVALLACEGEPQDYNDCILKKIKPGMSDRTVQIITSACREKFKRNRTILFILKPEDLAVLDVDIEFSGVSGIFKGSLYNGSGVTIERIVMAARLTSPDEEMKEHRYTVDVRIAPQTVGGFVFSAMDEDARAEWSITEAYKFLQ